MKKLNLFQSLVVFFVDASASFFIFQTVAFIFSYFYFLPFFPGFWAVWTIYYIVAYSVFNKTLGQAFFHTGIVVEKRPARLWIRILLREILTSFPGILFLTTFRTPIAIPLSLVILLVCLSLLCFRKKLFGVTVRRFDTMPDFVPCRIYFAIVVCGVIARFVNVAVTNDGDTGNKSLLSSAPRPTVNSAQKYVDFLKGNRQDINDYIMGLFDEYDHVILCERMHPEMTQYDMIYNLVTDSRFVDSVGVVFTEVGSAESRDAYRDFVKTPFANDTLVEKNLASFLMDNQTVWLLWTNTNWFDFLKKMYYFNHDRENKVEIMFSDRNWIDRSEIGCRDSIMADNIISTIESDGLGKSLTIMNYRHAFLTRGNCGYYLARRFPGRVANVMINSVTLATGLKPIQNGLWDVAAEQMRPVEFAFDFKGSPFGTDDFDYFPFCMNWGTKLTYQDMFTGMIYYKSLDEQYLSDGFNYIFEPENIVKIEERERLLPDEVRNPYKFLKGVIVVRSGNDVFNMFVRLSNIFTLGLTILSLILVCVMCIYIHRRRKKYLSVREDV